VVVHWQVLSLVLRVTTVNWSHPVQVLSAGPSASPSVANLLVLHPDSASDPVFHQVMFRVPFLVFTQRLFISVLFFHKVLFPSLEPSVDPSSVPISEPSSMPMVPFQVYSVA
jgi:hypothetical protein